MAEATEVQKRIEQMVRDSVLVRLSAGTLDVDLVVDARDISLWFDGRDGPEISNVLKIRLRGENLAAVGAIRKWWRERTREHRGGEHGGGD